MRLNEEEKAMLAGELGEPRRWAIAHQIAIGEFFDAADFVVVSQAHIMADTESLGEAGVRFLEGLACAPEAARRVRVPAITDPRGIDFAVYRRLGQNAAMAALEQRAIVALSACGVLMTDTCINYQTIMAPLRGEHVAYGDTGSVIYANSVCGARSNFEGGPSALAAALTGRTPRYGYHFDERRRATLVINVRFTPCELNDWGALGAIVGRLAGDYWQVPALVGIERVPTSDEMKHFGAALASYGSVALFHIAGLTPEARRLDDVLAPGETVADHEIGEADIRAFARAYAADADDVVVLSAPHQSLMELAHAPTLLDDSEARIPLLVVTSPQVKADADRIGMTMRIEAAGGLVLAGMCFYQSYAREMAEANGWRRLATNSAKLVNILGGYGYRPTLLSMPACIDAACNGGRLSRRR